MEYWDSVVLDIYFDYKCQWPLEGLNRKTLTYEVVMEYKHDTITVWNMVQSWSISTKMGRDKCQCQLRKLMQHHTCSKDC